MNDCIIPTAIDWFLIYTFGTRLHQLKQLTELSVNFDVDLWDIPNQTPQIIPRISAPPPQY